MFRASSLGLGIEDWGLGVQLKDGGLGFRGRNVEAHCG